MDPFLKLDVALNSKLLPSALVKKLKNRFKYIEQGISRVERTSGIQYPPCYVEPALPVATSNLQQEGVGILYARTLPIETSAGVQVTVQFTAALIALGSRWTIGAVVAHEFLHYLELMRRFMKMDVVSQQASPSIFELTFADYTLLFKPEKVFKDKALVKLLNKKLPAGLRDAKLDEKVIKEWWNKGLPKSMLPPDSNITRVSVASIMRTSFDPVLRQRIDEFERVST